MEWKERIMRYKNALEDEESFGDLDIHELKRMVGKLENMPMTLDLLIATGIGKTLNSRLRKHEDLGDRVKCLVATWKELAKKAVAEQEAESEDDEKAQPEQPPSRKESEKKKAAPKEKKEPKIETPKLKVKKEIKSEYPLAKPNEPTEKKSVYDSKPEKNLSVKTKVNGIKIEAPVLPKKKSTKRPEGEKSCEEPPTKKPVTAIGFTAETGISFDDILSMGNQAVKQKPKKKEKKAEAHISEPSTSKSGLKALDISKMLPKIVPDYCPLPERHYDDERYKQDPVATDTWCKPTNTRTKVFSGKAHTGLTTVPKLYDVAMRVICENIDAIENTGDIPFFLLEPALSRATPAQLFYIEERNPYLIEDSDSLWEAHCKKEFRNAAPSEDESWRQLYKRRLAQREEKLKTLASKISAKEKEKELPKKKAKQMFEAKAPRDVRRRQRAYGIPGSNRERELPTAKAIVDAKRRLDSAPKEQKPDRQTLRDSALYRVGTSAPSSSNSRESSAKRKPTVAPMMKKALKFLGQKRRR